MLIVLAALSMLSLSTAILFTPHDDLLEKNHFLSQLKSDLLYAQVFAISHQQTVTVHIMPEKHTYYIRGTVYDDEYLLSRKYSESVEVRKGSLELFFQYLPNGNIDDFGSLYITIGGRTYRLMILIGKGRFYVTEE